MYKSPITIIESTIDSFAKSIIKQKDDAIFAEIQHSFGVDLDREELIRALKYDREQYDKGYADGIRDAREELVRCKECKYWNEETKWCYKHSHYYNDGVNWLQWEHFEADDFCSHGERKKDHE